MSYETYENRLERINRLVKKREEKELTRSELARRARLSVNKLRDIERGSEVTGGEAKDICIALKTRWSEIWVKQKGMIVVREKKRVGLGGGCSCKL